jgi:hypothetical protein
LASAATAGVELVVAGGGCQSQAGLPASAFQLVDGRDHGLHLLVAEHDGAEHDLSDSTLASDSTISTACAVPATTRSSCDSASCVNGRVEDVLAVDVADAGGADRALERHARQRQRRGGADQRGMSGSTSGFSRHHRGDHLDLVVEALRETAGGSAGR